MSFVQTLSNHVLLFLLHFLPTCPTSCNHLTSVFQDYCLSFVKYSTEWGNPKHLLNTGNNKFLL